MAEVDELRATLDELFKGSKLALDSISQEHISKLLEMILKSRHIFVVGAGRSGLIVKSFAIKLARLGFDINVVGETVLAHPERGDLLIAVSDSGETAFTVKAASIAKRLGTSVVAVTSCPESSLGKEADMVIMLSGWEKLSAEGGQPEGIGEDNAISSAATMFEVSAMIFLNSIAMCLRKLKKQKIGG
ncbi:MAG: SIS domain-containing protein [Hadesarchaea archaeon]|nr:SIS domain-containing protein [Hadesarchaea archaeon]